MGSLGGIILWVALLILTGWRLAVLARADEPADWHKAVALLFAIAAASNTFSLPPVKAALDTVTPGLSYLCGYVLLAIMYSGFVYLFASGEKARPRWVRSFPTQLSIALAVSAVVAGLWLATPAAERATRLLDLGRQDTPLPYLGVFVLGSYLLAASALCAALAWGESRYTVRCARGGYTLAGIGMAVTGFGGVILRVPLVAAAWATHTPITDAANLLPRILNLAGIALLLIGLGIVAAHDSVEPRRAFLALRPLYRALCAVYPKLALRPPESFTRELLLSNAEMRDRWPHRAIACQDGLLPVGAHVAPTDTHTDTALDIDEQARLVLLGLDRAARGDDPGNPDQPCRFAVPADAHNVGFDSEVEHLIALSRAIARQQKKQAPSPDRVIRKIG